MAGWEVVMVADGLANPGQSIRDISVSFSSSSFYNFILGFPGKEKKKVEFHDFRFIAYLSEGNGRGWIIKASGVKRVWFLFSHLSFLVSHLFLVRLFLRVCGLSKVSFILSPLFFRFILLLRVT